MANESDFYERLGLTRDASPEEIRRSYHEAARRLHPDVNVEPGATEQFLGVQEAYEVLADPRKRMAYDNSLAPQTDQKLLDLAVHYSRSSLPHLNEDQLVYVLLDMVPSQALVMAPSPPLNVCLVLDCSTSMQGARLDTVKATAIELVRNLNLRDSLSIVSFSDRAEVLLSAGERVDASQIESRIRSLQTSGGTEIFHGLEAGLFEVRRNLLRSSINHIILLTDGHTYGDEAACHQLAERAAASGIGLSALGIGGEWNDMFLDGLASRTGGSSMYVSKPADIERFLKEKLQTLSRVLVENIALNLEMEAEVVLRYAYRLEPQAGVIETSSPLRLGNIPKGERLKVLLEFLLAPIPSKRSRFTIGLGRLTFDAPTEVTPGSVMRVRLERPVKETDEFQESPKVLVDALEHLTLYRMQEKARQEVAEGDIPNATRHLHNLASQLLAHGEGDLARTALMEADHIRKRRTFSDEGVKQIKYGTRGLLLPDNVDLNL